MNIYRLLNRDKFTKRIDWKRSVGLLAISLDYGLWAKESSCD